MTESDRFQKNPEKSERIGGIQQNSKISPQNAIQSQETQGTPKTKGTQGIQKTLKIEKAGERIYKESERIQENPIKYEIIRENMKESRRIREIRENPIESGRLRENNPAKL